jgi:electron transport complex protein RnfD
MNMLENKKFTMHKAPFIRKADHGENTTVMMRDFMIALAPLIIFAWVKNGLLPYIADKTNFFGMLYPLLLVLVGAASAFLFEFLWYYFIIKKEKVWISLAKSYPLIPGILLGMIVPVSTPLWLVVIGVFFATVVGKLLFGGFGNNIFNPALLGYLFLTFAYFGVMTGNNAAIGANSYFNAKEVADAVSSATPMTVFMGDRVGSVNLLIEKYGLLKMFLGFTPGALAETSALLCLLAFIFLTIRKTIDWRIPTIYVGSVFVLTYIIGAINGYAGTLNYALFGVLNGGLMFGAVFMATEPVTSPRNPNGVILYSFGLGALTVLFRFASSMPEGVATSILIMNMFTAALERFSAKLRVEPNKRKVVVSYALIGLLFAGIGTLAVVKNMPKHIEFVETEQDFSTFNFKYKFLIGGEEVVVEADKDGNLLSDVDEGVRAEIEALVSENQPEEFIASKEGNSITVQTKAYGTNPPLLTKVTYDPETLEITAFEADTSSETYESPYNEKWNKEGNDVHPDEALPNQILENQDDLDKVEAVTGATITSNSLIRAARIALDYLAYLGGKNE